MAFCVFCYILSRVLQHLALRFGAKRLSGRLVGAMHKSLKV